MKRKKAPTGLPSQERAQADEALAHQVAHIIGEHSAAAKSLAELHRRRELGLRSFLVEIDGSFWVGNWPPADVAAPLPAPFNSPILPAAASQQTLGGSDGT